nr:unnamed protein product [Callosobruchus analis]
MTSMIPQADQDYSHQILINYILAHARNDERPYLQVTILGQVFLGLLDSGATRTVIGGPGWKRLKGVCTLASEHRMKCTVANGASCEAIGTIRLPIQLENRIKLLDVLVIPSFPHEIILGIDFWRIMGVVPDLFNSNWSFRTEVASVQVAGIQDMDTLTPEQKQQLAKIVDDELGRPNSSKPRTVIVKFISFLKKSAIYKSKSLLKNTGIYINEDLGKPKYEAFKSTRIRNCTKNKLNPVPVNISLISQNPKKSL